MQWRNKSFGISWRTAIAWACVATASRAQLPQPKLDWVYPSGGQRGTKVAVTVGGTDLDEGREIIFSHSGIIARQQRTAADEFYTDGQAIANAFTVEIAADVPPGLYDAQVVGRHGVSTPRIFQVGDVAEAVDNSSNHAAGVAQPLKIGSVVSGRTDAEIEDVYSVELEEGEFLSCEAWAQRIDSQAELSIEVNRPDGAPTIVSQRQVGRDPLVSLKAPVAGKYLLRVHDALFRGGEAFFYRLNIRRARPIAYTMPPAIPAKTEAEVTFFGDGDNDQAEPIKLDSMRVSAPPSGDSFARVESPLTAAPRDADVERVPVLLPHASAGAERVWLGVAHTKVSIEHEPNDTSAQAQRIEEGEIAGQFFPKGDADWFEFQPNATGEWVFDLLSQRLGLATDAQLVVFRVKRNEEGVETLEQVAEADNGGARPPRPGCNTTTDDPYLRVALEQGNIYRIFVRDLNSISYAEPEKSYRLAVRRPQPDFCLLAAPTSPWTADAAVPLRAPLVIRTGGALLVPVVAIRQDGFDGEITVSAEGLPVGLSCEPATIYKDKSEANLVILADGASKPWVGAVRVVGKGAAGETELRHEAVATSLVTDTTTAKFERARLNHRLVIAVAPESMPVALQWSEHKVEASPGATATVKLAVTIRAELKEVFVATPIGLPDGVTAKFVLSDDKQSATLELSVGEKVPVGAYDFLLSAKPKVMYRLNPEAAVRAGEDQARLAKLVADLKGEREKLVAAAGGGTAPQSPEIKMLNDRIARGETVLKEATDRAAKLSVAAQPTERQCDVVTSVATLHVVAKAKR